jgi:hypothetical protein
MKRIWILLALATVNTACVSEDPTVADEPAPDGKADGSSATARFPALEFAYTTGHDFYECVSAPLGQIPATWGVAVDANLPRFQRLWNLRGEPMLRAAAQLLGPRFFTRTDRSGRTTTVSNLEATFTVCPNDPGMGLPLIIQMKDFVDLNTGAPIPANDDDFLAYTFHEILHRFIDDKAASLRFDGTAKLVQPTPALAFWSQWLDANAATLSPTVIKPVVLQHLHLIAIMKASWIAIGRADLIARERTYDATMDTTGSMATAWAITDLAGATDALVDEIRQRSR